MLSVSLVAVGCGSQGNRVPLVAVRGNVTYQGKPLPGALVVFEPVEPRKAPDGTSMPNPAGTTDEAGDFTLDTYEPGDGAPEGTYRVKISTAPAPGADTGILRKRSKAELTDILKGRYLDPNVTQLKATVTRGQGQIPPFDLK